MIVVASSLTLGQIVYPNPRVDDNYGSVACCTPVTPIIPMLMPNSSHFLGQQLAQYGQITDCALTASDFVNISVTAFPFPNTTAIGVGACDELVLFITVNSTATGMPITILGANPITPTLRRDVVLAKYARTWRGLGPDGVTEFRFWRYMIEGDAVAWDATQLPTASIPACYSSPAVPGSTFPNVCFRGYLDLMAPIDESAFMNPDGSHAYTLVLSHYDGCLDHIDIPLINARNISGSPASKHIAESYHLVTPVPFNWTLSPPAPAVLELQNSPHDSLRSTVSHTSNTLNPLPQCLGESPLIAENTSEVGVCNCSSNPQGFIDYNQAFLPPNNYAICLMNHNWSTTATVPEIPSGFLYTYLGIWGIGARPDVFQVRLGCVTGTVDYTDHCAYGMGYSTDESHIIWGNSTLWPSLAAANIPTVDERGQSYVTDFLLHFGNHVSVTDFRRAGEPSYVNLIWSMFR